MAVKKARKHARVPLQKQSVTQFKNNSEKQSLKVNPKNRKTQLVAQEIKFARLLADNDKRIREKVLKNLKKWLTVRSNSSFAFTEADFMRLWKGLFYCMWMSDKPLIQEELAESLSKIIHCFESTDVVLLYSKCAFKSLAIEWYGIDQYRIDKFAMLVRRILRQIFKVCHQKNWEKDMVGGIASIIEDRLMDKTTALGFNMHIIEIFWEELAKITEGNVPEETITDFIKPFAAYLTQLVDERLIKHVMRYVFRYLIFQSDVGMDYLEKFEAWRQAGFPCGSIDAMQKIEISDDEMENDYEEDDDSSNGKQNNIEKPLDPRAGRVNVELPQLPFNAQQISDLLTSYKHHPTSTTKSRRQLIHLSQEFKELAQGKMPLGVKQVKIPSRRPAETNPKKAALRFLEFEEELYSDTNKKKRKKSKTDKFELTADDSVNDLSEEEDLAEENDDDELDEIEEELKPTRNPSKKRKSTNSLQQGAVFDQENDKIVAIDKTPIKKKKKLEKVLGLVKSSLIPVKPKKLKKCTSGDWNVSDNTAASTPPSLTTPNKKTIESETVENQDTVLKENTAWLSSVTKKLDKPKQIIPLKETSAGTTSAKKRVKIVLQRNTAQHTSEYFQQVRKSPAIPFDANKKPPAGVLKASPIPSPVNPFYKKRFQ